MASGGNDKSGRGGGDEAVHVLTREELWETVRAIPARAGKESMAEEPNDDVTMGEGGPFDLGAGGEEVAWEDPKWNPPLANDPDGYAMLATHPDVTKLDGKLKGKGAEKGTIALFGKPICLADLKEGEKSEHVAGPEHVCYIVIPLDGQDKRQWITFYRVINKDKTEKYLTPSIAMLKKLFSYWKARDDLPPKLEVNKILCGFDATGKGEQGWQNIIPYVGPEMVDEREKKRAAAAKKKAAAKVAAGGTGAEEADEAGEAEGGDEDGGGGESKVGPRGGGTKGGGNTLRSAQAVRGHILAKPNHATTKKRVQAQIASVLSAEGGGTDDGALGGDDEAADMEASADGDDEAVAAEGGEVAPDISPEEAEEAANQGGGEADVVEDDGDGEEQDEQSLFGRQAVKPWNSAIKAKASAVPPKPALPAKAAGKASPAKAAPAKAAPAKAAPAKTPAKGPKAAKGAPTAAAAVPAKPAPKAAAPAKVATPTPTPPPTPAPASKKRTKAPSATASKKSKGAPAPAPLAVPTEEENFAFLQSEVEGLIDRAVKAIPRPLMNIKTKADVMAGDNIKILKQLAAFCHHAGYYPPKVVAAPAAPETLSVIENLDF
jgi:hypothetical protein